MNNMSFMNSRVNMIVGRLIDSYSTVESVNERNALIDYNLDYTVKIEQGDDVHEIVMVLVSEESEVIKIPISTELVLMGTDEEIDMFISSVTSKDYEVSKSEPFDDSKSEPFDDIFRILNNLIDKVNKLEDRLDNLEFSNYEEDDFDDFDDFETLDDYLESINELKARLILEELIEKCQSRNLSYFYDTDYDIHVNEISIDSLNMEILFENLESPSNSIIINIPKGVFYEGSAEDFTDYVNYIIREIQMREIQDDLIKLNNSDNFEDHDPDLISEFVINYLNRFSKKSSKNSSN